ncbi:MAG: molybdenum cofactor biosynthesis protein MoaA, partial [Nitrososphaerota archaeon]
HVRVSLKGCNENEFHMLTGADPRGFDLQLNSLKNLLKAGVSCHPSIMTSFSTEESLKELMIRLAEIDEKLAEEAEIEELILYPHVVERLKKYGLKYRVAHAPDKVPPDQI